jgi:hypothetical protein
MNVPDGQELPATIGAAVDRLYKHFEGYPFPRNLSVCDQCGRPEWSVDDIASTPLRSLSGWQLDAVHVLSLDDDALRHFFPRLVELLLIDPYQSFDFVNLILHTLKGRLTAWSPSESAALRQLLEAVWQELLTTYPTKLGYFSDCGSMLDFLDWCDISLEPFLDSWQANDAPTAVRHLADLISDLFFMPYKAARRPPLLGWLDQPAIGERLENAFFAAESEEAASQLSAAHELWMACVRS